MNQQIEDLMVVTGGFALILLPFAWPRLRDFLEAPRRHAEAALAEPTWEEVTAAEKPPADGRYDERSECGRCEGQGMFVAVVDGESGYVKCGACAGSGLRGVR